MRRIMRRIMCSRDADHWWPIDPSFFAVNIQSRYRRFHRFFSSVRLAGEFSSSNEWAHYPATDRFSPSAAS